MSEVVFTVVGSLLGMVVSVVIARIDNQRL